MALIQKKKLVEMLRVASALHALIRINIEAMCSRHALRQIMFHPLLFRPLVMLPV